jgi:ribosomal protein L12E/L44/L45/RPP1/RPP2
MEARLQDGRDVTLGGRHDQVTRNPWNEVTKAIAYDDENVKINALVSSLREINLHVVGG